MNAKLEHARHKPLSIASSHFEHQAGGVPVYEGAQPQLLPLIHQCAFLRSCFGQV